VGGIGCDGQEVAALAFGGPSRQVLLPYGRRLRRLRRLQTYATKNGNAWAHSCAPLRTADRPGVCPTKNGRPAAGWQRAATPLRQQATEATNGLVAGDKLLPNRGGGAAYAGYKPAPPRTATAGRTAVRPYP